MSPMLKKVATAVAVKKIVDRVQEARRPKRSAAARFAPAVFGLGLLGTAAYLFKSGKLQPFIGGGSGSSEPAAYPTGSNLADTTENSSGPATRI